MRKRLLEDRVYRIFDYLHEHIITVIVIVAVISALTALSFIVHDEKQQVPEGTELVEYEEMNTVYFAMDKVMSLNPLSSQEEDTYYISQLVFSRLFSFDETMGLKKDLVETYDTDAEDGSVSIKLKSGLEFSDGTDLTAYDVRFTVDQIQYIGSKSPYYSYADKIEYVEVESDRNLTIQFKTPSDAALDNLTFPIVSSVLYSESDEKPIGSGLYKYGKYANYKTLKLSPNKKYYGETAKNKLLFKVIADKEKIPGLMTIDSVTAAVTEDNGVAVEAEDKNLQVKMIPSSEMEFLGFSFRHRHLKDSRVRKAIAKAINLKNLVEESYGGAGLLSDTIYYPNFLGVEATEDAYEVDQVGASELLKQYGFVDEDGNGILEDKKGREFTLELLVNENNESRVDAAETIVAEVEKIGIKASVKKVSWSSYKRALQKGRFDMYLGGYDFDDTYNLKELFGKNNYLGYDNRDAYKLVKKMETTQSIDGQKESYTKLRKILIDELPYYCIAYKAYHFISVSRFEADVLPTYHNRFAGCGNWQWERVKTTKVKKEEAQK